MQLVLVTTFALNVILLSAVVSAKTLPEAPSRAIIGGNNVSPYDRVNSYSYVGQLDGDSDAVCGATAIAPRYLVTAAHCHAASPDGPSYFNRVVFNQVERMSGGYYSSYYKPSDAIIRNIESFIVHPEYNYATAYNDIAIIRLSEDLPEFVKPVAVLGDFIHVTKSNSIPVTALGWGMTTPGTEEEVSPVLKFANSFLGTMSQCTSEKSIISDLFPATWAFTVNKYFFCVPDNTKDGGNAGRVHGGDSGGPLLAKSSLSSEKVLVGVTSCGREGSPGGTAAFFTRTSSYKDFINEHVTGHRFENVYVPESSGVKGSFSYVILTILALGAIINHL